jgi:hypothetical protein
MKALRVRFTRDDAHLAAKWIGFYLVVHMTLQLIALLFALEFAYATGFLQQSDLSILGGFWGFWSALFLYGFIGALVIQNMAEIILMFITRRSNKA